MRRPGFSLVELLVVMFVAVIVVLAVGSFYVQTTRAWMQGQNQANLRRLASLVQQEMGRIIGAASGLLPGACGPDGAAASLPIQLPAGALPDPQFGQGGYVCLYREPVTDQLIRCRFDPAIAPTCITDSEANLLAGVPINDPIRLTDLPSQPGSGLSFTRQGGTTLIVSFSLAVFDAAGGAEVGPMTFATRFAVRN